MWRDLVEIAYLSAAVVLFVCRVFVPLPSFIDRLFCGIENHIDFFLLIIKLDRNNSRSGGLPRSLEVPFKTQV